FRRELLHQAFNSAVYLFDHVLIVSVTFQRLPEREDMLFAVVTDKRLHDRLFTGSDSPVAQLSPFAWIASTRQSHRRSPARRSCQSYRATKSIILQSSPASAAMSWTVSSEATVGHRILWKALIPKACTKQWQLARNTVSAKSANIGRKHAREELLSGFAGP